MTSKHWHNKPSMNAVPQTIDNLAMMSPSYLATLLGVTPLAIVTTQYSGNHSSAIPADGFHPVASTCGPSTAKIACTFRYGTLLPPTFSRDADPTVGYTGTLVPDDSSWGLVTSADFVVFDEIRGLELLGSTPKITKKYLDLLNVIHEAPIYVPSLNKLFVTQDGPPGNLSNIAIDLNNEPPTVEAFVTDPPVYQATGGILHNGMIYWAMQGNNVSLPGGLKQRPGIVRVDPRTYRAEWLINNYFGFFFGGLNDLTVDPVGDIWFTDSGLCTPFTIYIPCRLWKPLNLRTAFTKACHSHRLCHRSRSLPHVKPEPIGHLQIPPIDWRGNNS